MPKRLTAYLLAGILGVAIGAFSALAMSGLLPTERRTGGPVELNGWYGDLTTGSAGASPWVRARIARHGLLALANSEAIYFTRTRDDSGRPFTEDCRYRITGQSIPARWWSVTLYNDRNFLPDNRDNALSYDASRADDGTWSAIVAAEAPANRRDWISSRAGGAFDLTLRLYVPADGVLDDPEGMIAGPSVERLSCDEGSA